MRTLISLCSICGFTFFLLIFLFYPGKWGPIPASLTNANAIRDALVGYADKHNGHYPDGKSSTEIFQQLTDDHQLLPDRVFFELTGKSRPTGDKLKPDNVCFDFSSGADANSPRWIPLVFPTGYSINYRTGEATRLSSSMLTEDVIKVIYPQDVRVFKTATHKFYFWSSPLDSLSIMPGKPTNADVSQYHQLTPDGSL